MIHINFTQSEGAFFYAIFTVIAILAGIIITAIAARKSTFHFRELAVIASVGIILLIIGSKVVVFDQYQWYSLLRYGHLPLDTGKSVVGALIGGMIGVWGGGRLLGNKSSILDVCAIAFPVSIAIARAGCLFAGCCHGNVTHSSLGITYGPGSKAFIQQVEAGLIPQDAISTLLVHPHQLYSILACVSIALIVWITSRQWKSPSGRFIFSVLLYLGFRFFEEFTRFRIQPEEWLGLQVIQWKIAGMVAGLATILFYRERNYAGNRMTQQQITNRPVNNPRLMLIACAVLVISFYLAGWLTASERTIMLLIVMPLSVIAIAETMRRAIITYQFVKPACLLMSALVLMSQKSDVPEVIPSSYTSFNITTGAGQYNLDHKFNSRYEPGGECEEGGIVSDHVVYRNAYKVAGIGVNRKIYYNQWRSLLASLNIYRGTEIQTPIQNTNVEFDPPMFTNTLWSINPMFQYDTRGIGLGLGASFGILGHDLIDDPSDLKDYNPKMQYRNASLQYRLRLFSERFTFIELLGGHDMGSVGEYNWQVLVGSRFNSDKLMLKGGYAWTDLDGSALVMHGQFRLSPRFYVSPQLMINVRNNDGYYNKSGYRAALGIEYRINDKK